MVYLSDRVDKEYRYNTEIVRRAVININPIKHLS